VAQLHHEAEQASERYNDARLRLEERRQELATLQRRLDRQLASVDELRDLVAASIVANYQGQALSTAAEVVLAEDPEEFLASLATISEYTAQQADVIEELALGVERLEFQEQRAQDTVDAIAETKEQLAEEKATYEDKAEQAEDLLGRMVAERREQRASRSESRVPVTTEAPASGGAAAAVQYAMAQVGDSYVYGAAGPDAFDCSGLTMMAWAQAGVSLPHSSSAQMSSGTPVSVSSLVPGDLVFYYSPVSHVGIYVGNGMIAHAANPSTGVRVDALNSMPVTGAVRPG
jgi:cell wall-associated NlpC family hydrolase